MAGSVNKVIAEKYVLGLKSIPQIADDLCIPKSRAGLTRAAASMSLRWNRRSGDG